MRRSEIALLEGQIKDIANLRAEIDSLKARQKAVEDLQTDRNVPVHLLNELTRQAMGDELGDEPGSSGVEALRRTRAIEQALPRLLADPASPWWDRRDTADKKETRATIVAAAWQAALQHLRRIDAGQARIQTSQPQPLLAPARRPAPRGCAPFRAGRGAAKARWAASGVSSSRLILRPVA